MSIINLHTCKFVEFYRENDGHAAGLAYCVFKLLVFHNTFSGPERGKSLEVKFGL